ncbi:MAG: hypothetical protein JNM18_05415, partial [Planctomycetaceae bacterium]|nr:hypothetical protein [Planctomycetaceae bacterium]
LARLNELAGTDIQPIHEPARVGDIRQSMADITFARRVLGFEPQTSFAAGLEQSIAYYRELVEGRLKLSSTT